MDILKLSPEEQDVAEAIMRAQLSDFEAEINSVKEQVHSNLAEHPSSLHQNAPCQNHPRHQCNHSKDYQAAALRLQAGSPVGADWKESL